MKHFQYSCVFLFVAWLASASGEAETGAKSQIATQILTDEIRVETITSLPSWVIGNDEVELAVTHLGARTFVSITGKQVSAAINWEFLKTGALQ